MLIMIYRMKLFFSCHMLKLYDSYVLSTFDYSSVTVLKPVLFFYLPIDDDIDDEEFYDDHLEAYFEQLAIPGMIYEDLEGQEPSEKDFKLPTSDSGQVCSRVIVFRKNYYWSPWIVT